MKKQLVALGAFLVLALGALPSMASCHFQSQSYQCPCKQEAQCSLVPVVTPCCESVMLPCGAAAPIQPCCQQQCCEKQCCKKPCCQQQCYQPVPCCPAAPINPCCDPCCTGAAANMDLCD